MANNNSNAQQTIEGPLTLAEDKQAISTDPYHKSEDGHFVGSDGFIVPKNFQEYFERHPLGVCRFVMKKLRKRDVDDDVRDMVQDLHLHLQQLPEKSKHRKAGKTDIIQCFDPEKQHGASAKRFHNYISICLTNRLYGLMTKRKKNPLFRFDTLSITEVVQDDDNGQLSRTGEVSAEYLYKHSSVAAEGQHQNNEEQAHDKKILVEQYTDFVRKNAPELIPVMEAIAREENDTEAQQALGMSATVFARHHERLRVLMDCLQTGRDIQTAAQRRRRMAISRRKRKINPKRRTLCSVKRATTAT